MVMDPMEIGGYVLRYVVTVVDDNGMLIKTTMEDVDYQLGFGKSMKDPTRMRCL